MNQYRYSDNQSTRSSGCARVAMIGGGCIVVLLLGFVGLLVAGGVLWDRGSEAGGNFVSNWVSDQIGTDISGRVDAVEDITVDLPETREFSERDAYLDFLDSYNREFVASMERVGELLSNPRLQDDQWNDDVAREIAVVRHLESEAREVQPPPDLTEAHDHWVSGMGEYRRAIDTTAEAMDNVSPSGLVEAIDAMNNATQSYVSMAESLDEMGVLDDMESIEDLEQIDERP